MTNHEMNTIASYLYPLPAERKETMSDVIADDKVFLQRAAFIKGLESATNDYEEVLEDHKRLVREIDVIINGKNAAKQASLCDLVSQFKNELKVTWF